MNAAWHALVAQIDVVTPPFAFEHAIEVVGVAEMAGAFCHPHIKPNAKVRSANRRLDEGKNAAVVPPDRGGKGGDPAKDFGVLEPEIQRDEAAQRGAAYGGVFPTGLGAVSAVNLALEFFDKEACVTTRFAASEL